MQNSAPYNKVLRNSVPKHWIESGNDTDASGSSETLGVEEQQTLWHMQRQEPQGQEQNHGVQSTVISVGGSDMGQATSMARNNDSNLSFGSSTNTLIIHHSVPDESWSNRWLAGYTSHNMSQAAAPPPHNSYIDSSKNPFTSSLYLRGNTSQLQDTSADYSRNSILNSSSTELKEIPNSYLDKSEILKHLVAKDQNKYKDVLKGIGRNYSKEVVNSLGGSCGLSDQSASSSNSGLNAGEAVTPVPRTSPQYHNVSPMINRMPPPYYSHFQHEKYDHQEADFYNSRRSVDKNTSTLSKSQPDLSNVGISKELTPTKDVRLHPLYSEDESNGSLKEMIDILNNENHTLKIEIDYFHRKITKLQKFEIDIVKVEEQHQSLVKMGERREQLERLARHKLHCEVRRLAELNADLKEQLKDHSYSDAKTQVDAGIHRTSSFPDDPSELVSLRKELGRKDTIISQLVSQNRELTTLKSDIEKDCLAKDKKIKEQQKQIDILDSALTSTQTTVLKLEDEVKKNQNAVDQAEQLRKVLLSMQRASTRLDQSEKNIKQKLEDEIIILRSKNKMDTATSEILDMRSELRSKDEKILYLESEMAKMKQKIMLEAFKNQIDHHSPASLKEYMAETSQHEKEMRISQTKLDHIKSSDEYKNMCRRMEELELCNRSLEAVIAEREAKIKALNRKAEENSNVLSQSNVALDISTREDKNLQLRREPSVGRNSIPRKDEELGDISSLLSFLSNLSLVSEETCETTQTEIPLDTSELSPVSNDAYSSVEKFYAVPKIKKLMLNLLESKEQSSCLMNSNGRSVSSGNEMASNTKKSNLVTVTDDVSAEQEIPTVIGGEAEPIRETTDSSKLITEIGDNKDGSNDKTEPDFSDKVKTKFADSSRMAPPPYHGHHQILKNELSDGQSVISNVGTCNHKKHGSNNFCRSCQNIRRSARQAPLVRRANSSACHPNRRSVPSPSSSLDSLEDAPSILERLKKEWELGMLPGPSKETSVDGSRTLPYPLATVLNRSQNDETEMRPSALNTQNELRQFSDEMSNLIESKADPELQKLRSKGKNDDDKVELVIREDCDEKSITN